MNAEERQAFKEGVINREIREQQNGFIEVLGSVLNVTEVLGVTSSLKVFKPSIPLSLRPLSETKAFKEAIRVIKTAPQKMENLVTQVKQSFTSLLGDDLGNILQPNKQVASVRNINNININGISKTTAYDATAPKRPDAFFSKIHHHNNKGSSHQSVNNPKPWIKNTREDVLNFYKEFRTQGGKLGEWRKTKNGHYAAEIQEDITFKGIKYKNGDYFGKDDMHNEIEWFRGKNKHMCALSPRTGRVKPGKDRASRHLNF